jgi:hypothetical protein
MSSRKIVKLNTKGLDRFANLLSGGVTFTTGIFDKVNATKGYQLEYGRQGQVARPWFSSAVSLDSDTFAKIMGHMTELVQDALRGKNTKRKIADKITIEMQNHLLDQNFSAASLKPSTIRRKKTRGSITPRHIGLDSYDMVASIKTKSKGGKRE